MIHNPTHEYADKFIKPLGSVYLFCEVYGIFKGIKNDDVILLTRESKTCKYKVCHIKYITPHSKEFYGKVLWIGYMD